MPGWGRDELEWEELVGAGRQFLVEVAARRGTTSYTELNAVLVERTGLAGFDFSKQADRAAMGHLLGLVVEREAPTGSGPMLSALVHYVGGSDAGAGFYALAQQRGLLRKGASTYERMAFWVDQLNQLYALHAGGGAGA
ncbi:hypothetical protein ACFC6L_00605 [Kitasatospora phosalacinea]|uniref:hypothetical protein n=1 Tax=Kitasatospora phosalacinea TaxID=2065 RepID=UPI0035D6AF2E